MVRTIGLRLLLAGAAVTLARPACAQPFLYSIRQAQPCNVSGCAGTSIVITNGATGEIVNADDPPLLGPDEGHVYWMTTSVDGRRLYVSAGFPGLDVGRSGRLFIINLVTNRTEAVVPMQHQQPWMLVADPGGRVLYGTNPLDGRVSVIDAFTGQVTSQLRMQFPFAIGLTPDGSVLAVTEVAVNTVTLLDPRTLSVRLRVNVPDAPQRIAMSPDGTRMYVSCHSSGPSGTIVTIDTRTGAVLNSVSIGGYRPDRILVSPKTGKLYVTFTHPGAWGVVDTNGNLATYPADVPASAKMAASADWRRLYISGVNGIIVIDTATDAFEGRLPGGGDLYLAVTTPCDFTLPGQPIVFNAAGGSGTIAVPAPAGCEWAVQNVSLPSRLQLTSAAAGIGAGQVTFSVAPSATPFTANIRIAGQTTRVSQEIPRLWIDTPRDGAVSSPFVIAGWTLAESVGATSSGIDVVHAWAFPADGTQPRFLGSATMDGPRPDVANAFGAGYGRSGFSLTTPWLRPGRYQISVYGRSRTGQFDAFAAVHITAVGESGAMALDFPATSLVVQPGSQIFVAGWALDRAAASGPGVDTIHVWAFPVGSGEPVFLGSPAYGNARPDVGGFFGLRFTPSGFSALLPAPSPGVYDLAVFARSTPTGVFDQWRVVRISVGGSGQ